MTLPGHEPERPPVRPEAAVAHLDVAGMDCECCPTVIGRVLSRVGGVHLAVVSLGTETAVVTYEPRFTYPSALLQAVATAPSIGRRRFAATVRRIGSPDGGDASRSAPRGGSAEDVVPGDTVAQTGHPALEGGAAQELGRVAARGDGERCSTGRSRADRARPAWRGGGEYRDVRPAPPPLGWIH